MRPPDDVRHIDRDSAGAIAIERVLYFRLAPAGGPPSRYFVAMCAPCLGRKAMKRAPSGLTTVKACGVRAGRGLVRFLQTGGRPSQIRTGPFLGRQRLPRQFLLEMQRCP